MAKKAKSEGDAVIAAIKSRLPLFEDESISTKAELSAFKDALRTAKDALRAHRSAVTRAANKGGAK